MPKINLIDPLKSKILEENKWLNGLEEIQQLVLENGKVKADKMVKAVFLLYDSSSPYRETGMSLGRIKKDILKNIISKPGFTWRDVDDFAEFWQREVCTQSEKPLYVIKKELDRFEDLLESNTKLTLDNAADRAKVIKEYGVLVDKYRELQKQIKAEERTEGKKKKYGGYQPSLLEKMKK